ncbi:MAG TPA: CHAT domain-containing protein [Burkholderiaceae bacterium]|nr:CHAT domain-containing protein [Burkholderiaceae bacterium]
MRARTSRPGEFVRHLALGLLLVLGAAPLAAFAQPVEGPEEAEERLDAPASEEPPVTGMTHAEAQRLLAEPEPTDAAAALVLLEQQERAARVVGALDRYVQILHRLAALGRSRSDGWRWPVQAANAEFKYGSQGKAVDFAESFIGDNTLPLEARATLAVRQAFYLYQLGQRMRADRSFSRADGLVKQALADPATSEKEVLRMLLLQARSEWERAQGDLVAAVESLREAVALGRAWSRQIAAQRPGVTAQDRKMRVALLTTHGVMGSFTYALARASRYTEAVAVAGEGLKMAEVDQLGRPLLQQWHYRLANAHLGSRNYASALTAAEGAEKLAADLGTSLASHTAWLARRERVFALIGLRRWAEADAAYNTFLAGMPPDALARSRAADVRLQAVLAAKNGRTAQALELIEGRVRYRRRVYGDEHPLTQEFLGVRGLVHLLAGNVRQARADYEDLFQATLDKPSGWIDLGPSGVRGYTLAVAFEEFLRYVAEASRQGETLDNRMIERALQVADYLNLTVTHEALVDSTARFLALNAPLQELLAQEQAQRRRLRELYGELAATLAKETAAKKATDVAEKKEKGPAQAERKALRERMARQRESIDSEQNKLGALRAAIAKQHPGYADLVTPTTPAPAMLRRLLAAGEALVLIYPMDAATLVWSVTPEGRTGFHAAPLTAGELHRKVAAMRAMLDLSRGSAAPLQPELLLELYRVLLQPLAASLKDASTLIVAAQSSIAALPFAALLTDASVPPTGASGWLIERMAVTQLPTTSSLQALRRTVPSPAARPLIGFGDPLFDAGQAATAPHGIRTLVSADAAPKVTSYGLEHGFRYAAIPPLPETRTELLAIAAALNVEPAGNLFFGADATRRRVLDTDLSDRRVMAFATHGLMPGELPGISKPALALAGVSDPRESALLLLDDVLGLKLNAQWVVLSGCNTAAGEAGGAAMSGLVRGFFLAGARSVLATHWAVETESAAALVGATFRQVGSGSTKSRAASLREAQLAMLSGKLGNGAWAHPFFWAPYSLFGDPAR